jgi:hypothetical protein
MKIRTPMIKIYVVKLLKIKTSCTKMVLKA